MPMRGQSDFDGVRPVRDRDAVFGLMVFGESLLKLQRFATLRSPPVAAFQHLRQRLPFQVVIYRPLGKCFALGGRTALDGKF